MNTPATVTCVVHFAAACAMWGQLAAHRSLGTRTTAGHSLSQKPLVKRPQSTHGRHRSSVPPTAKILLWTDILCTGRMDGEGHKVRKGLNSEPLVDDDDDDGGDDDDDDDDADDDGADDDDKDDDDDAVDRT